MIDYNNKSDFEINMAVALLTINYEYISPVPVMGTPILQWEGGSNWHQFDPCNNPSDAWPIIIKNGICIIPYKNSLPCAYPVSEGLCSEKVFGDDNVLRAAMIVFLMMQDTQP